MIFTENDLRILKHILDRNNPDGDSGLSPATATSVKEIVSRTGLSDRKVRNTINQLLEEEYIAYGVSQGRTKRYYVLTKGLKTMRDLSKTTVGERR